MTVDQKFGNSSSGISDLSSPVLVFRRCQIPWKERGYAKESLLIIYSRCPIPRQTKEGWLPCWLLKLRQMGTQQVQIKGFLPWLVRVRCNLHADTRGFWPALSALVGPSQTIFFLKFQFCPYRPASWAAVVQGRLSLNVCSYVLQYNSGCLRLDCQAYSWPMLFLKQMSLADAGKRLCLKY